MKKEKVNNTPLEEDEIIGAEEYAALPTEEQNKWMKLDPKYERIPLWSKIALGILPLSAIIYLVICLSPVFADFFNKNISGIFRFLLAQITNIFPFSLAESAIILIPVILFLTIRYVWIYRCNNKKQTVVTIVCVLSIASIFISGFVWIFSAGYRGSELEEKLGIESVPIDKQDLYDSAIYLTGEINKLSPEIQYDTESFSVMPYSMSEMNDKLLDAYEKFSKEHDFINTFHSKLKPVILSEGMSYAHITGVYTFFTGESNLNVGFPDYTIPFTAAHELAHQRGIAREDEANMMAFLVCINSDDVYIRYCAYVNMYEYVANALYSADKELFRKADSTLSRQVYSEQVAYSKFFKKYQKSVTSQISGAVNDIYLQSQGTAGRQSYGMVVDLTVAYFKEEGHIEKNN